MIETEATIPVETLGGLQVEEGDLLRVTRKNGGTVTLATRIKSHAARMSGDFFVKKWGGAFDVSGLKEIAKDDPQLAHILEKHVS